MITNQGKQREFLSTDRRTKWLAAISRGDLTENVIKPKNDRVCGIHFIEVKPLTYRIDFYIQIGFLARENQEL